MIEADEEQVQTRIMCMNQLIDEVQDMIGSTMSSTCIEDHFTIFGTHKLTINIPNVTTDNKRYVV